MSANEAEEVDPRSRAPTYHDTKADYSLPNDSVEQTRLEDQAAGLEELMHHRVIHAPLPSPTRLLDVGCGTGIQTCQFGAAFPSAQVYGIDLSAVPPRANQPSNVEFVQGDIREGDGRFAAGSMDYVFSRLLILGMTDWQGYVCDVASLLRQGGWAEMQDYDLDVYRDGDLCSEQWGWLKALRARAKVVGWDLNCGSNIKGYMERAGLVDVQQIRYRVPFGSWLAGERPETGRIGEHAGREYGMLYFHGVAKMLEGAGYGDEVVREFQEESRYCLRAEEGKEITFFTTIGRKP